jgi:DNA-binding transcriptional LysR family regulator
LTPAGEALVRHARIVLTQVEQMRGELRDFARGGIRGRVWLWSNTAALEEHLPDLLSAWLGANPGIDVEIEERQSQDVAVALLQGRADIGVLSEWAGGEGLALYPFRDDQLVVATSLTHPLANKRSVRFTAIGDEEFIGLAAHGALAQHIDGHAQRLGLSLRYRVRLRSFDSILRMVERGVGIAVLPEVAVKRRRRTMKIASVTVADDWARRRIVVAVRKSAALPAHAQRLLDHLLGKSSRRT